MFGYVICFLLGMSISVLASIIMFESKRVIVAFLWILVLIPGLSVLLSLMIGGEYADYYYAGIVFDIILFATVVYLPMVLKESVEERQRQMEKQWATESKSEEEEPEEKPEEELKSE